MTEQTTAADDADLHCPLCEYNLRGLAEPRCPECGFAFTWAELRAADRNRHPWLFEHGGRRNVWSLWMTWWRNRRPWRFWREVTPSNPVRIRRLARYWAITALVAVALTYAPLPHGLVPMWNLRVRRTYFPLTGPIGVPPAPPTWPDPGWVAEQIGQTWQQVRTGPLSPELVGPALMILAWPWLSAVALMMFRASMRQARINPAHAVRAAVYGCDFGLAVFAFVIAYVPLDRGWHDGVPLLCLAAICGGLATFRMTFAYGRYLRFRRPFAMVLASQVLVFLAVAIALARTTNLTGLFQ